MKKNKIISIILLSAVCSATHAAKYTTNDTAKHKAKDTTKPLSIPSLNLNKAISQPLQKTRQCLQ